MPFAASQLLKYVKLSTTDLEITNQKNSNNNSQKPPQPKWFPPISLGPKPFSTAYLLLKAWWSLSGVTNFAFLSEKFGDKLFGGWETLLPSGKANRLHSTWKWAFPKRKGSSSNHLFSGATPKMVDLPWDNLFKKIAKTQQIGASLVPHVLYDPSLNLPLPNPRVEASPSARHWAPTLNLQRIPKEKWSWRRKWCFHHSSTCRCCPGKVNKIDPRATKNKLWEIGREGGAGKLTQKHI